jgi:hypothetical protein
MVWRIAFSPKARWCGADGHSAHWFATILDKRGVEYA